MGDEEPPWLAEIRAQLAPTRNDALVALASLGAARPALIYHYTDAKGLQGILESRAIWATNALFLNDRSELSYVDKVVASVTESLVSLAATAAAERLVESLRRPNWRGPRFEQQYVSCFSAAKDRLSQWRAYAGDGRGYAIGFDTSAEFQIRGATGIGLDMVRVLYQPDEQREVVTPFVRRVVDAMNLCPDSLASEHARAALYEGIFAALDALSVLGIAIKNHGFAEEAEWRLAVTDHKDSPTGAYMKYRPGAFGITPYVEFEPKTTQLPIREVALGPRLHDAHARTSTAGILAHHGYETTIAKAPDFVPVTHSEATYRGGGN